MNGNRGLIIAVAAAFIVGCSVGLVSGMLFTHVVARGLHGRFGPFGMHQGPPPFMGRGGPWGAMREHRMFPYLAREMDLTAEQQRRMRELMDRARREHEAVRESMEVWLDRELTPAQRARWRELEERMGMPRHGRMRGGPPPPDRP